MRACWLFLAAVVIVGSLLPGDSFPMVALDRLHLSDKFEHFGAYALLAFLPAVHECRRTVVLAAIGAIALGVGLEFAQLYSGWRDFEIGDMIADAAGVCGGLMAGIPLRRTAIVESFLRPERWNE
jgi:VanZ family protein